jgi:RND family efflux transporter MFP subunit
MIEPKDKAALLNALRIERDLPAKPSPRGWIIGLLALIVMAGLGAGGWYYWRPDSGIPVHAVMVTREGGSGSGLDASGYVVARRQATLSAKILGKVVFLNAEEGQQVHQGDIVARLDDSNYSAALHQAKAQELAAEAALADAQPIYTRYRTLHDQKAISTDAVENQKIAYDTARTALDVARAAVLFAQSNENDTIVRSPFSGVVTDKVAQVGEIVAPAAAGGGDTRTGIATIVDMDSLEVQVDVSENYIDRVRAGEKANIALNAYPDWAIPAAVIAVIPTADQSKGTVKVRIAINTKDPRILPQMGARVSFQTGPASGPIGHALTVPPQAISGNGADGTVFLIEGDAVLARPVKVGLRTANSVTIISGVAAGDRLAVGDLTKLRDGAKVSVQE